MVSQNPLPCDVPVSQVGNDCPTIEDLAGVFAGMVMNPTYLPDADICRHDPVDQLHMEGSGSAIRSFLENPDDLYELMLASGMVEGAGEPFRLENLAKDLWEESLLAEPWSPSDLAAGKIRQAEQEWIHIDRIALDRTHDWYVPDEVSEELEWAEVCEPSYFKEYLGGGEDAPLCDKVGIPIIHDAQKHDQVCALNHMTEGPQIYEHGIPNEECTLASVGEKYAVAITQYGACWVPKSCLPYLPGIGETFKANISTTLLSGVQYNLKVEPGGILY